MILTYLDFLQIYVTNPSINLTNLFANFFSLMIQMLVIQDCMESIIGKCLRNVIND